MQIPDTSLRDLVAAVAADRPSPGAGAAAGAALALAAACGAKAFRISARRSKSPALSQAADVALDVAAAALAGAQEDCEDFPGLLSRQDADRARQALRRDGLALLEAAARLRTLLEERGGEIAPQLEGDLRGAEDLIAAAEAITRRNLEALETETAPQQSG